MDTSILKGIYPPIVTPITEKEDVDEQGLRKLINHCIERGLHGIFVAGTNGETLSLTQEQRDKAISIALSESKGKVPVMAGVMDSSTRRVIENIKRFEQMGGEFAVVTSVFYSRHASPRETIRHFEEISRNTQAKIVAYNIPPFTGMNMTADMVIELSKIDKVVGLKDSGGNFIDFLKLLYHFKGTSFKLFQGLSDLAGSSVLLGADGLVVALAPLFPEIYLDLYESSLKKDTDRVMRLSAFISLRIMAIVRQATYGISAVKYATSLLGFFDKRMIKPSEPVKPEEEEKIREAVRIVNEEYQNFG